MNNLFTMSDDEILAAAQEITAIRHQETIAAMATETARLYKLYASKRDQEPHNLGKPKALTREEALLLVALERNRYDVNVESPNGGIWSGSAFCRYGVRSGTFVMRAQSRRDVLLGLWASVSEQDGKGGVLLTEEHLRGSLVQAHIRDLWQEVRRQEAEGDTEDDD